MKLTRIVKIRVNLIRVNFVERSSPRRQLSAALNSAPLISSSLTPILEPVLTFLTPKKH